MKLQLPSSISSAQDLSALILEIHGYSKWFSHNSIKHHVDAKSAITPPILSPVAIEMVRNWTGKELLTQQSIDQLIAELENFKATAPSMTITLAAPAAGELKQVLVTWCRQNIAPDILVNFTFNSTLLGGMVVRYGSRVFDWSFRRQILANRAKFPEVLRRV